MQQTAGEGGSDDYLCLMRKQLRRILLTRSLPSLGCRLHTYWYPLVQKHGMDNNERNCTKVRSIFQLKMPRLHIINEMRKMMMSFVGCLNVRKTGKYIKNYKLFAVIQFYFGFESFKRNEVQKSLYMVIYTI